MVALAFVRLWGQPVGVVWWDAARSLATFAYDPGFVQSGLTVAPLQMPLPTRAGQVYVFRRLNPAPYHSLPGLRASVATPLTAPAA